jgi:hypothetical protein
VGTYSCDAFEEKDQLVELIVIAATLALRWKHRPRAATKRTKINIGLAKMSDFYCIAHSSQKMHHLTTQISIHVCVDLTFRWGATLIT